ncbi:PAS domain-containing protein, partial [Lacticaseibacillus rhamnosus]|uniref:PAS domain-containing protein n=1 Tax=Lacticaseibacillus rhamnosus TaxID=47715 RepID=UPI001951B49B
QDAGRVGSFIIDSATQRFLFSDVACDILGRPHGWSPLVEHFAPALAPVDRERVMGILRQVRFEGGRRETEYRIVRDNDGEERWVSVIADSDVKSDGTPVRRIGTFHDITERKRG